MVHEIEKAIPIPENRVRLSDMEVGDSILFALEVRSTVASNASRLKLKTGKDFTIRKVDEDNCRVWRIA